MSKKQQQRTENMFSTAIIAIVAIVALFALTSPINVPSSSLEVSSVGLATGNNNDGGQRCEDGQLVHYEVLDDGTLQGPPSPGITCDYGCADDGMFCEEDDGFTWILMKLVDPNHRSPGTRGPFQ